MAWQSGVANFQKDSQQVGQVRVTEDGVVTLDPAAASDLMGVIPQLNNQQQRGENPDWPTAAEWAEARKLEREAEAIPWTKPIAPAGIARRQWNPTPRSRNGTATS